MWDGTHFAAMKSKSPGAALIALGAAFVAIGRGNLRWVGVACAVIGVAYMLLEKRFFRPKP
jgi:hypothetical protein